MRPPAVVLFDMDDVLCTYRRPIRAAYLARLANTTTEAVMQAVFGSGFEALSDAGFLDTAAYLRGFGERIGYSLTQQEWLDARRAAMVPRPEVLEIVRQVSGRARVAVLTNNPALVSDHIDELFPELPPLFGPHVYTSAGFRAVKPSPQCYRRCLAALGAKPTEVLFVDDLYENVAGATAAGLHAVRYRSPAALAQCLREYDLA